jgi:hypothetical protein
MGQNGSDAAISMRWWRTLESLSSKVMNLNPASPDNYGEVLTLVTGGSDELRNTPHIVFRTADCAVVRSTLQTGSRAAGKTN